MAMKPRALQRTDKSSISVYYSRMSIDPRLARLAQTVRRKCNLIAFREGESLAAQALLAKQEDDERVVLVRAPYFDVPPTVCLYLETQEWSCDCGGELDPCAHVAAALVALTTVRDERASEAMAPLEGARATLAYRFVVEGDELHLRRCVIRPDGQEREVVSLADAAASIGTAALIADEDDRAIDRMLALERFSAMDERSLSALFDRLRRVREVTLGHERVEVRSEPEPVSAKVVAKDRGWSLTLDRPEGAKAIWRPGVVRSEAGIAPLRGAELIGSAGERAPWSRSFDARDTAELVARVLPELEPRVRFRARPTGLPVLKTGVRPTVLFEVSHGSRALEVRPWIVYGDPPMARVEAGRLVWLRGDVPARDEAAEVALGHRLRDELGLIAGRAVTYEGEDAGRFLRSMRAFDQKTQGGSEKLDRRALVPLLNIAPSEEHEGTRVELSFSVEEPGARRREDPPRRASAESVLRAYEAGLDLVALEGGGFAPLPREWLAKNAPLVAQLLAARDANTGVTSRAAASAVLALCERMETPPPPSFARLRPMLEGLERLPRAALPADLRAELRPYQRVGVDWLCFLRDAELGAVLADDMGLGKTLQCLASLRARSERGGARGALVVCPRSVLHNWAEECARFRPGLRVTLYHGDRRALDDEADVTITTYAILRIDRDVLAARRWDAVVLDEAQNIKNPDSQSARAAYSLEARTRVALSGTPIENKLEELWSLMHFANPGLLGGRSSFEERVARPVAEGDARALADLRERVRPFVLRRRKSEVLEELPPRTDVVLHCELDPRERAVYDAVRAASLEGVVAALREGSSVMQALELLLRLRQASCDVALVPGQASAGESSKVTALCEALEDAVGAGHKALVFSQWTSLLDRVEPALRDRSLAFTRLDGATRDRAAVVNDFQREDGPPVLLATLKAGGTGLNLTAADHVFLLDPWWNPAAEDQAADRAHRMGQKRAVTVYRLVSRDTVEERILALQRGKRALAAAALDEGALGEALTREDLLALLA